MEWVERFTKLIMYMFPLPSLPQVPLYVSIVISVYTTFHQQCLMCHHISKFIFVTTSNLPLHALMYYILMSTTVSDTRFTHPYLLPIQVVKGSEQHVQPCLPNSQYTDRWVENLQRTISLCNLQNVVLYVFQKRGSGVKPVG